MDTVSLAFAFRHLIIVIRRCEFIVNKLSLYTSRKYEEIFFLISCGSYSNFYPENDNRPLRKPSLLRSRRFRNARENNTKERSRRRRKDSIYARIRKTPPFACKVGQARLGCCVASSAIVSAHCVWRVRMLDCL